MSQHRKVENQQNQYVRHYRIASYDDVAHEHRCQCKQHAESRHGSVECSETVRRLPCHLAPYKRVSLLHHNSEPCTHCHWIHQSCEQAELLNNEAAYRKDNDIYHAPYYVFTTQSVDICHIYSSTQRLTLLF